MIKVNLLPKEIQDKGKGADWIILGYGVILLLSVIALSSYFIKVQAYNKNTKKKELWSQQLQAIKAKVTQVEQLDSQKNILNAKKNTVVMLLQGKLLYPKMMESFFNTLPKEVWITDMTLSEDASKNIKISALSNSVTTDAIADWLQILESKSERFTEVNLSAIEARTEATGKSSTYSFTITFVYHPPPEQSAGI